MLSAYYKSQSVSRMNSWLGKKRQIKLQNELLPSLFTVCNLVQWNLRFNNRTGKKYQWHYFAKMYILNIGIIHSAKVKVPINDKYQSAFICLGYTEGVVVL